MYDTVATPVGLHPVNHPATVERSASKKGNPGGNVMTDLLEMPRKALTMKTHLDMKHAEGRLQQSPVFKQTTLRLVQQFLVPMKMTFPSKSNEDGRIPLPWLGYVGITCGYPSECHRF